MRGVRGYALMVLSLAASAPAAEAAPSQSAASAAQSVLLHRPDLGAGWSQSAPAPSHAPGLACTGAGGPNVVRPRARAASPTFAQTSQGPFAFDVSAAFASATTARGWWRQVVHPALAHCFARVLAAGSGGGVKLKPSGTRMLTLAGAPPKVARYRVTGQATAPGQNVPVYLDVILITRGRFVAELQLSNFDAPTPNQLELRLTRLLTRRLASA